MTCAPSSRLPGGGPSRRGCCPSPHPSAKKPTTPPPRFGSTKTTTARMAWSSARWAAARASCCKPWSAPWPSNITRAWPTSCSSTSRAAAPSASSRACHTWLARSPTWTARSSNGPGRLCALRCARASTSCAPPTPATWPNITACMPPAPPSGPPPITARCRTCSSSSMNSPNWLASSQTSCAS